ncbi:HD domain-containing protein [Clostridium sp. C105KSO13]|uniref:HD domain-containing protein n=1 Tax=Clostridium sp. C105KSO13 TaxID=1776045 RepID=UPI00074079DD|nr:HD domain-containing protein [Clostridium sp. C105KSO13]CUX45229.1 Guanosine-3',5'-bis(diphosphate) 3'-pyrophosphohydrolase [Clostridium sp. C105KSO13]
MFDEALEFASKAHEGQFRKGTKRPYIVHPVEVADIVASMTKDEELIAAAVLHDTMEDCPGVTEGILEKRFGKYVASLVAEESEDKSKTWEERKGTTIRRLKSASKEVQMIALADKLSNMRDIDREYPVLGEELWKRFRMNSKAAIGWYYKGVRDSLKENLQGVPAYEEYCALVEKNFGREPASPKW